MDNEGWSFDGGVGADPDHYDFNRGAPGFRNPDAEALVKFGALLPGENYDIIFKGEKPIKGGRKWKKH